MKKILFSLFVVFALLAVSGNVFAYQCKDGQSLNSDECWTEVKIGEGYTTLVSRGHILVVSIAGATVDANDGYLARLSSSSADEEILGVAQKTIASGERALILARGRGVVKLEGPTATIASGDILGVTASGTATEVAGTSHVGRARFGVTLEAGTSAETTAGNRNNVDAYIWN